MAEWTLAGAHLAERCQLVLMIALGESVLRVGLTFSQQSGTASVDAGFVVGFVATVSLWGMYFLRHAERGAEAISRSPVDAARLGRAAYAYAHAIMVVGVIVVAVAVRLTIDDAGERHGRVGRDGARRPRDLPRRPGAVQALGPARRCPAAAAGHLLARAAYGGGTRAPIDRLVLSILVTAVLAGLAVGAGLAE